MSHQPPEGESPNKALWVAAQEGRAGDVSRLLAAKADATSYNGRPPLFIAALNGHVAAARLLLAVGADVNQRVEGRFFRPLGAAAVDGYTDVLSCLLAAKADVCSSGPLESAAGNGYLPAVRCLLEAKVGVRAQGGLGSSALMAAARFGHTDVMRYLLGMKVSPNPQIGYPPLTHAAAYGHAEAVVLLLQAKASLNGALSGETPLHCAVQKALYVSHMEPMFKGCMQVIGRLLLAKADPTLSRENIPSPLAYVEQAGKTSQAESLGKLLRRASIFGASAGAAAVPSSSLSHGR